MRAAIKQKTDEPNGARSPGSNRQVKGKARWTIAYVVDEKVMAPHSTVITKMPIKSIDFYARTLA